MKCLALDEGQFKTDDVTDYVINDYPDTMDNGPLPAWDSGSVTEDQARQACIKAIDSSPAASSCTQVNGTDIYNDMIDTCLKDIQVGV